MAVIIPFADADAHGSICDTVSFRRSRGKVVFQKKPKPKQPNSPGQQTQKQWFKDTWKEWRKLTAGQKNWLAYQAAQEQTTPANYFFDKYKDTHGPCGVPQNTIKQLLDVFITTTIAPVAGGIVFLFWHQIDDPLQRQASGIVRDNENDWAPPGDDPPHDRYGVDFIRNHAAPLTLPEDYEMVIDYKRFDDSEDQEILYWPEWELAFEVVYTFYFDCSMSMYTDQALTQLVKANYWPYTWPPEI